MNSCELTTLVSSLACAIVKPLNNEDAALLAAIFTQLGDSIVTILATQACDCKKIKQKRQYI